MKRHELMTWTFQFQAIWDGVKTFELRENDRGFQVGDQLHLREFNMFEGSYTGRELVVHVPYILDDSVHVHIEPFVIMSIIVVERIDRALKERSEQPGQRMGRRSALSKGSEDNVKSPGEKGTTKGDG